MHIAQSTHFYNTMHTFIEKLFSSNLVDFKKMMSLKNIIGCKFNVITINLNLQHPISTTIKNLDFLIIFVEHEMLCIFFNTLWYTNLLLLQYDLKFTAVELQILK